LWSSTPSPPEAAGGGGPAPSSWDARRILQANLIVLGVAACFLLLYRFAAPLFILFVGIALGMAVRPGVEWLRRHGVPRWAGALAIYAALAAIFTGVLVLVVPVVAAETARLLARAPHWVAGLRAQLSSSESHTLQRIAGTLPPQTPGPAAPGYTGYGGFDVSSVASTGAAVARNVLTVVAVLLLGFYWTLEGDRRTRALALFAPLERRRALRTFVSEVEHTVGAYLRGQSLVCLIIGVLAFVIYTVVGLPHAAMLGLVYAIGEAVPVIGPIVGTATAALVALSVKPALVLWVVVAAAGLQLTENYLLIPRVMKRVVGVNPLVTLLAVTGFGSVLGIAGAVLAIPMAAIVQLILYRSVLDVEMERRPPPPGRDRTSVVRYEVRELARGLRRRARTRGSRPAPVERIDDALEGIAIDLDHLLGDREAGP
jgi:predicted PurR-regulated permease PerM